MCIYYDWPLRTTVLHYLRRWPIVGIGFAQFDCREHIRPETQIYIFIQTGIITVIFIIY
jgi:hypothetical protein